MLEITDGPSREKIQNLVGQDDKEKRVTFFFKGTFPCDFIMTNAKQEGSWWVLEGYYPPNNHTVVWGPYHPVIKQGWLEEK